MRVHARDHPDKTLREAALNLSRLRRTGYGAGAVPAPETFDIGAVMEPVRDVLAAHHQFMGDQLARNGVEVPARAGAVRVGDGGRGPGGDRRAETRATADAFIVATGSRPRHPAHIPVDHDSILDSDSIPVAGVPAGVADGHRLRRHRQRVRVDSRRSACRWSWWTAGRGRWGFWTAS